MVYLLEGIVGLGYALTCENNETSSFSLTSEPSETFLSLQKSENGKKRADLQLCLEMWRAFVGAKNCANTNRLLQILIFQQRCAETN